MIILKCNKLYYSHLGRHAENYGEKIDKHHKFGIVFAVEMEKEMIFRAPQLPEAIAVTKGYIAAAVMSKHGIRPYIKDMPEWIK